MIYIIQIYTLGMYGKLRIISICLPSVFLILAAL